MLGWAAGFFVLSIIAAIFGFGGVATAFASVAQILFVLFLALFVLSVLFSLVTGGERGGPALTGPGRTLGLLLVVGIVVVSVYAWVDNGWTGERIGRAIDRRAVEARADAGRAFLEVSERTRAFVASSREDLRRNAENAGREKGS